MLISYLKLTLGNLLGNKLYSAINVLGLATGLAACLLISLFVRHEFSYDRFFADAARIWRLSADFAAGPGGPERRMAGNVAPLAPLIRANLPEGVSAVARIGGQHALVATQTGAFYEENFRWADPDIFRIFRFEWLRGDPARALQQPDGVVISASMARKYFGDADPLGQTLLANLIAWPLAYVAMARWLGNFAYRIDLSPLIFIGSGAIALCVAWVTVGGTAAKAASARPVLALRYE